MGGAAGRAYQLPVLPDQNAQSRTTVRQRSRALGAPPRHAFGNFRLPVGDRACPAATRRPALSPVHRFRPGRHGGRIGRDTVAAASSRDRLPAALHAAAGDPSESGGNPVWLGMSALTLLFTCGLWIAAWKMNHWIAAMLLLKMEKCKLADELSSVLADLERKVEQRTYDLRLARDEADRANQMKTRFLAAASHDLGQPFQAMRLFIDLLDSRLKGTPHYNYLQSLARAHLTGEMMLTSLLDLSRLESVTVQLRVQSFPISDLF